jgi:O-antigen ligase
MFFFYWLIAVMPLENHWLWGHVLFGTLTVIKVLGLLCLLIALYRVATGHVSLRRFYTGNAAWILAFAAILGFAAIRSLPQVAAQAWSHVFSVISLLITVPALVTSRKTLNRVLLIAIGAAGLASLYTLRQQRYYDAGFRVGGMSGDPNYYALLVGLWMPLAFLWALSGRPRWERLFCGGCLLAMLAGCIVAASRGGSIGLATAFVYLLFRSKRRARNGLIAFGLVLPCLLLMLFMPSSPLRRFTHPNDGDQFAEQARVLAWKSGIRMLKAHPLMGVGLHNFELVILQYEDPTWLVETNIREPVVSIAHNTYVEIASEVGLPGLIAFLLMLASIFRSLERDRRQAEQAKRSHLANIASGLQAGLLCFALGAFFLSDWWEKMFWLLIFLVTSLHYIDLGPKHSRRIPGTNQRVIPNRKMVTV